VYILLAYATYALLAVTASALLLAFCLALLLIREGLRTLRQTWFRMLEPYEPGGAPDSSTPEPAPTRGAEAIEVPGSVLERA